MTTVMGGVASRPRGEWTMNRPSRQGRIEARGPGWASSAAGRGAGRARGEDIADGHRHRHAASRRGPDRRSPGRRRSSSAAGRPRSRPATCSWPPGTPARRPRSARIRSRGRRRTARPARGSRIRRTAWPRWGSASSRRKGQRGRSHRVARAMLSRRASCRPARCRWRTSRLVREQELLLAGARGVLDVEVPVASAVEVKTMLAAVWRPQRGVVGLRVEREAGSGPAAEVADPDIPSLLAQDVHREARTVRRQRKFAVPGVGRGDADFLAAAIHPQELAARIGAGRGRRGPRCSRWRTTPGPGCPLRACPRWARGRR